MMPALRRRTKTLSLFLPRGGRKYSEDQARDEGGRWTDSGGGGGGEARGEISPVSGWGSKDSDKLLEYQTRRIDAALQAHLFEDPTWHPNMRAGAAKAMVVNDLANASGIPETMVNELIRGWASTSNDEDYRAMWMQKMAAEEFGVPLSGWQEDKLNDMDASRTITMADPTFTEQDGVELGSNEMTPFEHEAGPSGAPLEGSSVLGRYASQEEAARSFLRAQYDGTQAQLRAAGITEVVAYRGYASEHSVRDGTLVPATPNALQSWSLSSEVAMDFAIGKAEAAGVVLQAVIPADRILSMPTSGFGCLAEQEIVVLGGPGKAMSMTPEMQMP